VDVKDNRVVFNGLTYGLVLSPHTGRVWLDRNLAQWQFYREFAIVCGIDGVVFSTELEIYRWGKLNIHT
jgi:hypothetical protein